MKKINYLVYVIVVVILFSIIIYYRVYSNVSADESAVNSAKINTARDRNTLSEKNYDRSYVVLMKEFDNDKSIATLRSIVVKHSQKDPVGVFAMIQAHATGSDKTSLLVALFEGLAMHNDLDTALKLTAQLEPGRHRTEPLARFWANVSICTDDQLQAQFDQFSLAEDKIAFMNALTVNSKLAKDQIDAFIEVNKNDPSIAGSHRSVLARKLNENLGMVSGVSGILDDDDPDMLLVSGLINHSVAADPEQALVGLCELGNKLPEHMASQAVANAVGVLAQKNPEHSSGIVLAMKDGALKSAAMFSLVTNWFNQDSMSVSKWISSINSDADKDLALKYFIPQLIYKNDNDSACQWVDQIKSEKIKKEMIQLIK
jgi:hypothetical protein